MNPIDRIERYVRVRDEKRILNISDDIHSVHNGTEWEAALSLTDLRELVADYRRLQTAPAATVDMTELYRKAFEAVPEARAISLTQSIQTHRDGGVLIGWMAIAYTAPVAAGGAIIAHVRADSPDGLLAALATGNRNNQDLLARCPDCGARLATHGKDHICRCHPTEADCHGHKYTVCAICGKQTYDGRMK